jgi:hypothetical protein
MSMSQRTADEREQRKGLVLGLTLAEVLLLLLFLLMVALSWRISIAQKEAELEREKAQSVALELSRLKTTLVSLAPLLEELRSKGGLNLPTVQELADKIARAEALAEENARVKKENATLHATLGNLKLLGSDIRKLAALNDVMAMAEKLNPDDPPALLKRAVEVLRHFGPEIKPEQMKTLSQLTADSERLKGLEKATASAAAIDPNNIAAVLEHALEVLNRIGPTTPLDKIVSGKQHEAVSKKLEQTSRELERLKGPGNGLTYPPCWKVADNQPEYMFDITIRDEGLIVRDAAPNRAGDPDMKLVGAFDRNAVINETVFRKQTARVFEQSKKANCRHYVIIRDEAGQGKVRYKALLRVVEGHFYKLEVDKPWAPAAAPSGPPVGGPIERAPMPLGR